MKFKISDKHKEAVEDAVIDEETDVDAVRDDYEDTLFDKESVSDDLISDEAEDVTAEHEKPEKHDESASTESQGESAEITEDKVEETAKTNFVLAELKKRFSASSITRFKKFSRFVFVAIIVVVVGVIATLWVMRHHQQAISTKRSPAANSAPVVAQITQKSALPINQTGQVLAQLNGLSDEVALIGQKVDAHNNAQGQQQIDLMPIISQIHTLDHHVSDLGEQTASLVTLFKKMNQVMLVSQAMIEKLNQAKAHRLINPAKLPFKVVSIDNINEKLVITVSQDHMLKILAVGDVLSGWHLSSANINQQKAVFTNTPGSRSVIHLNQNGGF